MLKKDESLFWKLNSELMRCGAVPRGQDMSLLYLSSMTERFQVCHAWCSTAIFLTDIDSSFPTGQLVTTITKQSSFQWLVLCFLSGLLHGEVLSSANGEEHVKLV
jgi:hypothetical protein